MTFQITNLDKDGIARIATGTASVLLLYTAIAVGNPRQPDIIYDLGVQKPMRTMSTAEPSRTEYIIEPKTRNWVKFKGFMDQWRRERGAESTVYAMAVLPSYQKIIGMGEAALPFILTELKLEGEAPDHWFWALAAISDDNPVPQASRGKLPEMAKAWIEWGQKEGYVE